LKLPNPAGRLAVWLALSVDRKAANERAFDNRELIVAHVALVIGFVLGDVW
jgi:hypothetical protein